MDTDQPRESVYTQRPLWLEGVSFWTVQHSTRCWAMHHDTFTASVVMGPTASVRAKWHSRGEERAVSRGCVQLMTPGEAHRTTAVAEPTSFFVLWWTPATMDVAARELGAGPGVHLTHAQLEPGPVGAAMTQLHDAVNTGASRLEVDHWYVEATSRLLQQAAEQRPARVRLGRHHPGVRRALDFLHGVFRENVSLDELAKETRISKFHLARCFRESTGLAPHQYQKLLRLQAARRLIETGVSVQDAALRAGFADAPHLARSFRGWLGVSPSQWARASRSAPSH